MQTDAPHLLLSGSIVIMRTDTVYGLIADASNPEAVMQLYTIKGRQGKPGTLIAASIEQFIKLGLSDNHLQAAATLWPGPNSVVVPAPHNLQYLHLGLNSLAVRIPNDTRILDLLNQTGPLATTSANLPGHPNITSIQQAKDLFGDQIALYLDGGIINSPQSSNVFRLLPDGSFDKLR